MGKDLGAVIRMLGELKKELFTLSPTPPWQIGAMIGVLLVFAFAALSAAVLSQR
jgi:hypothetical protein